MTNFPDRFMLLVSLWHHSVRQNIFLRALQCSPVVTLFLDYWKPHQYPIYGTSLAAFSWQLSPIVLCFMFHYGITSSEYEFYHGNSPTVDTLVLLETFGCWFIVRCKMMLIYKSDIKSLFHASHPVTKATLETFFWSIWEPIEIALLASGLLAVDS